MGDDRASAETVVSSRIGAEHPAPAARRSRIPGLAWVRGRLSALQSRFRWIDLAVSVIRKGGRDGAGRLAAVVAYYAFFSLFPLLLVLVFVLGVMLDGSLRDDILDSAFANFPVIGDQISGDVGELDGSGVALVIGVLTALWAGTHAFDSFDQAMHVVWNGSRLPGRSMLKRRLRALVQLGVLGGALVATTGAGIVLNFVVRIPGAARPVGVVVSILLNIAFALVLYRVADSAKAGWRDLVPGAVVAGVGLTALQTFGHLYLTRLVGGASDTYGSLAFVIGLLSWLHLLASLLIWSAELSVVLWLRRNRAAGLRRARAVRDQRRAEAAGTT